VSALVSRIRSVPTWQLTLFGALVALGFLIAAQARTEAPRVRYTTQERAPLVETVVESGPAGPTLMVRLRKGENVSHGKPIHVTVDVVRLGSEKAVQEKGLVTMEGKDYLMQDGDIVEIHI